MGSKEDTISKVYFEPSGFGSIKKTFEDARKKDKSITLDDVKDFFKTRVEKKNKSYGFNSYVAPKANYEYQCDLFFITSLENQKFKIGTLMIDVFTKFMTVIPVASKSKADLTQGLVKCMENIGKEPEIIYTDGEGGINTDEVREFLKDKGIDLVIARSSAYFAERAVRTFKDALFKRVENSDKKNVQWTDFINDVLITYNYKHKHSTTNHTPGDARNPKNEFDVKLNLLAHKKHTRVYSKLKVGDEVKVLKKKTLNKKKESYSTWFDESYKIDKITQQHNQPFYELKDFNKPRIPNRFIRSDLLNQR